MPIYRVFTIYLLTCDSHPTSMFSRLVQTNASFSSLAWLETMPALALSTQFLQGKKIILEELYFGTLF